MAMAILYDSVKCRQCGGCVSACKVKWGLPWGPGHEDKLDENTFTVLENHGGHPVRRMCMHCESPSCVSVCPVTALSKTKEGPVVYDEKKCMGCRYCMVACPFSIPRYEWSKAIPRVRKCVMCFDRVKEGQKPACTLFCPYGGIQAGDRDEMLALAKQRIAEEPGNYHDHVFGEHEVGGTNVLIIAAVPPQELGLPGNLPLDALPERTWAVLSKLPPVVGTAGLMLGSVAFVIHRRNRLREEAISREENAGEAERVVAGRIHVKNRTEVPK